MDGKERRHVRFSNPKELLYHCIGLILVVSTDIHQISKARGFMSQSCQSHYLASMDSTLIYLLVLTRQPFKK